LDSPDVARYRHSPAASSARINGAGIDTCIMHAGQAAGGGDWCEAFAVGDDVVALSIGDVCGHGIAKMEVMGALRDWLHVALLQRVSPSDALEDANRFLQAYDHRENATAICALLDIRRRSLTFANVGHPPPLMVGPYGATYLEFARPDVPLGVCATINPTTHVVSIAPSTLVVLYTDGVSEHERDPLAGAAELFAAAVAAHALPATDAATYIRERLSLTGATRDDAAIMSIRMPLAPVLRRRRVGSRGAVGSARALA
jgi:serine phosphatase RsbU (regulator of sigma subunit)